MGKYSYVKVSDVSSRVIHTEGEVETYIATTDTAEKAHFLATAANQYHEPLGERLATKDLIEGLKADKSEGRSLYYAWQSNIAMAIYDEFHQQGASDTEQHNLALAANRAAKRFLDLLTL